MKQITALSFAALSLMALVPKAAHTDGCMMPTEDDWKRRREKSLILEPDQKALLYFQAGREQLIISPNYAGEASRFAWVVPVPSRPKVEILKGAPFHELARLVEPVPPPSGAIREGAAAKSAAAPGVTVIERKTVGDYEVSVLSASDSHALISWLKENHYHLPEKAAGPVQEYIKEGWTFVASKIKQNDTARGLKTGTLTPLKLTFSTSDVVYPMRLSAANATPFRVLLYIAQPLSPVSGILSPLSAPGNRSAFPAGRLPIGAAVRLPYTGRYESRRIARPVGFREHSARAVYAGLRMDGGTQGAAVNQFLS